MLPIFAQKEVLFVSPTVRMYGEASQFKLNNSRVLDSTDLVPGAFAGPDGPDGGAGVNNDTLGAQWHSATVRLVAPVSGNAAAVDASSWGIPICSGIGCNPVFSWVINGSTCEVWIPQLSFTATSTTSSFGIISWGNLSALNFPPLPAAPVDIHSSGIWTSDSPWVLGSAPVLESVGISYDVPSYGRLTFATRGAAWDGDTYFVMPAMHFKYTIA